MGGAARTRRALAGLVLVGLAACGGRDDGGTADATATTAAPGDAADAAGAPTASDQVTIVDFGFDPAHVTVPVGTTVTWTNQDDTSHSIEDRSGEPSGPPLALGDEFSRTYDEAGSFPYVCGIHNYMQGTVTVT